ncbi:MAG TPA: nuclear transport factor 2 family protein [Kofleriaceae bacterium]|nr:nuclear transport factor 2 family protein [Kofleriaceae bacterium]
MADPDPPPTPRPPPRALLRVAGVLSQLTCGACLLIGTIGLVLVLQNKAGGVFSAGAWLVTAMAGLVFGGLIYRGGLVSTLIAAGIDAGFGIVLLALDHETLRGLLKILPASDVDMIASALTVAGIAMLVSSVVCLIAVPQAIRFARWMAEASASRGPRSTARGFPPPPVPARGSTYILPDEEPASRRRLYVVLGVLAVAVGATVGALVSTAQSRSTAHPAGAPGSSGSGSARAAAGSTGGSSHERPLVTSLPAPGDARLDAPGPAAPDGGGASAPHRASEPVTSLLAARRDAIARLDLRALAALMAPSVFGFGIDADEVAEGRDAVVAQIAHDLGEPPGGSFTVESRGASTGQERDHAWIAEGLEVSAPGSAPRRFEVTELAAVIDGSWKIVALHWAIPVADATAERLAILKTLPMPEPIPDRYDGADDLHRAVRAAFASRAAFADAFSERPDAFNDGSGGERVHGGAAIKRIFGKLRAQLRLHDGARVVAGGAWDPAQAAAPWIGWAAINVDFTSRTRAATEVTQTLRVLAIFQKDGADWKIVQTQWSNGGPIR